MTLKEFAQQCGVTVFTLESIGRADEVPDWGGEYGYRSVDEPHIKYLGFQSEDAAYSRWLEDTFGENVGPVVASLLLNPDERL